MDVFQYNKTLMNTFTKKDVADYYDQTINHYQNWWKLNEILAIHSGLWYDDTKSFSEALINVNKKMAEVSGIKSNYNVLDAGCGVGGAAFYLANNFGCKVTGITLSKRQLKVANDELQKSSLNSLVKFEIQDFTKTNFKDNSFDIVWACESVCHVNSKKAFIQEAYRILKPGGKLILCDYFLTHDGETDEKSYIKNWGNRWAVTEFIAHRTFPNDLIENGFEVIENLDITENIFRSAKRLYYSYVFGLIPSILYNLLYKSSRFSRTHYQSGNYQYKALKKGLWEYRIFLAKKVGL
jgi:tocopherol O-methyltransferase